MTDKEYLIVSTPLQYVYDNRDNKLNPTKGFRLFGYIEPAYDMINTTTFVKVKGEASVYQALDSSGKVVLAGRAVVGSIFGAEVEDIPADRRFYAGGGGSVRGYAYQGIGPRRDDTPTGGLSLVEGSAELRFQVTDTIGIVPFIDAGTVSEEEFPDFADLKVGAGLGFRYLDPIRPVAGRRCGPVEPGPGRSRFRHLCRRWTGVLTDDHRQKTASAFCSIPS